MKSIVLWCASVAVIVIMMIVAVPKATKVFAAGGDFTGAAWSANIGWIDLGNGSATYGVKVATSGTTRNLSGYAWSSNIGWVHFGNTDCPSGYTNCQPRIEWGASGGPSVLIKGFARACSVFVSGCSGSLKADVGVRGGWDGFISLGDSKTTDAIGYGLKLNTSTGIVAPCTASGGCAWGSEVVGWVDFSGVRVDVTGTATCPDGSPIPTGGVSACPSGPTTCPDGSTPVAGVCPNTPSCPIGSACYCATHPTDYQNCPNNCPANPAVGSACWCQVPANSNDPRCQSVGGICSNIPDAAEQALIAQGMLADSATGIVKPPYYKNAQGACLCTSGYIMNPVTFVCTKPVYTEQ